jgi:hypothetical protein
VARRQRAAGSQQQDRLAQFAHVVTTFLGELHVAPELGHADRAEDALPFRVRVPNPTTVKAMEAADRGEGRRFSSPEAR